MEVRNEQTTGGHGTYDDSGQYSASMSITNRFRFLIFDRVMTMIIHGFPNNISALRVSHNMGFEFMHAVEINT